MRRYKRYVFIFDFLYPIVCVQLSPFGTFGARCHVLSKSYLAIIVYRVYVLYGMIVVGLCIGVYAFVVRMTRFDPCVRLAAAIASIGMVYHLIFILGL